MKKIIFTIFLLLIFSSCVIPTKIIRKHDLTFLNNPNISILSLEILKKSAEVYNNIKTYEAKFSISIVRPTYTEEECKKGSIGFIQIKKPIYGRMELKDNPFNPKFNGNIKINNEKHSFDYIPLRKVYVLDSTYPIIFKGDEFTRSFSLIDSIVDDNPVKVLTENFTSIRTFLKEKLNEIPTNVLEIKIKRATKYVWIGENDNLIYKVRYITSDNNGFVQFDETHSNIKINSDIPDSTFVINIPKGAKKIEKIPLN